MRQQMANCYFSPLLRNPRKVIGKQIVEGDFPRAYATLDRLYATLEKYVRMAPPSGGGAIGTGATTSDEDVAPVGDSGGGESGGGESGGGESGTETG